MGNQAEVVYWDSSAILSVLFRDPHSDIAVQYAKTDGVHFLSTLAYAEVCAVIARMQRDGILSDPLVRVSMDALDQGPWRRLSLCPDWRIIKRLSEKKRLRGADLWHLATAKTLKKDLPELTLFTFDARLRDASNAEELTKCAPAAGG